MKVVTPLLAVGSLSSLSASNRWTVTTESVNHYLTVYDAANSNWNSSTAIRWRWRIHTGLGFSAAEVAAWGGGTDAKLRTSSVFGGQVVVACDGSGLATILEYPSGKRKWGAVVGNTSSTNLHSIELLPNGNVVVAASAGGFVRVYSSSQGPNSTTSFDYGLPGAHGVVWDPQLNVLWAVGNTQLVALNVTGTDSSPVLTQNRNLTIPLTAGLTPYGHDVWPVYGDPDKLWVAVNWRVWQFSKSAIAANAWLDTYTGSGVLFNSGQEVKSVGSNYTGEIVYTYPLDPTHNWVTDTVSFTNPTTTRTVTGAQFYKCHPWIPDYLGTVGEAEPNLALKNTITASTAYETSLWGKAKVVDGQTNSVSGSYGFSTTPGNTANHTEWIEVNLPVTAQWISKVVLYPRNDAGFVGVCFPEDFKIQVWNGSTWLDRVVQTGYAQPGNAPQTFTWPVDLTTKIRIYATKLRTQGGYYMMQFAEIQVRND